MSTKDRDGRRLRVRGTIITGVGIVAAAAAVWFTLGLLVYLAALGVVAIGLVHLSAAMQRFRDRGIGLTLSALIVVVAVAVPWGIATVERTGVARWVVPTAGDASYTYSDGSRVLFLDDDGIHAVDLRDGSVLWSHEGPSARGSFHVAADGHVLVHYGLGGTTRKVSWISPDGEVLWNVDTMGTSDADILSDDVVFRNPLASSGGYLVVMTCEYRSETSHCRHLGIGPDGSEHWSRDATNMPRPSAQYRKQSLGREEAREIPEVAVVSEGGVDPADGELTPAVLVDPEDGTVKADIEVGEFHAVLGDTVVYEAGPASEPGFCRTRGLSIDGDVSWARDIPCLSPHGFVLGRWIYGSTPDGTTGEKVPDEFVVDPSTGQWRSDGSLSWSSSSDNPQFDVPGTDVLLRRDGQRLLQIDPATGRKGWTLDLPREASSVGAEVAHGAALVHYDLDAGHNPFFSGDDRTNSRRILAVDTRSGRVTGSFSLATGLKGAAPVAPGQVLIHQDDRLVLIGSEPD